MRTRRGRLALAGLRARVAEGATEWEAARRREKMSCSIRAHPRAPPAARSKSPFKPPHALFWNRECAKEITGRKR